MSCPLPCNSAKESGLMPERRWRLSVFWVTRNRSLPSCWSSKRDMWETLGATSPGGTRHVGAGSPASRRVHTPSGPRKSGIPESVLIPAPVKATMCSEQAIHRAIFPTCHWRRWSPVIIPATWQQEYWWSWHLPFRKTPVLRNNVPYDGTCEQDTSAGYPPTCQSRGLRSIPVEFEQHLYMLNPDGWERRKDNNEESSSRGVGVAGRRDGGGERLRDGRSRQALELLDSKTLGTGVVYLAYQLPGS